MTVVRKPLTGAHAAAEAMKQINPDVVAVYPITPQTHISTKFSGFVADGKVDTEIIQVESEHSAMSCCVGASAAGARVMTATASAGFALMFEILGVASGLRLPIVMNVANRALSAPINIHCDHADSMAGKDISWVQIYSQDPQEVYENTILAMRLAETIRLPVMVMQDGFFTTESVNPVNVLDSKDVKRFVGEYHPKNYLLDVDKPYTVGPLALFDSYFEMKRQQEDAMQTAKKEYLKIGKELSKLTDRKYGYFEDYMLKDAEHIMVVMSSTAGTAKDVVDRLRKDGKKVGLLRPKLFRPFPYDEIADALSKAKTVAVLDRSASFGADAPLFSEIKNALFELDKRPKMQSYVFGLGGRDIYSKDLENVFNDLIGNKFGKEQKYIGLNE
jgi:pyruvate ferredoxin oxidoreductase alpha subunit